MTPRKKHKRAAQGCGKVFSARSGGFLRANRILCSVARADLIRIILRNGRIVPRDSERIAGENDRYS